MQTSNGTEHETAPLPQRRRQRNRKNTSHRRKDKRRRKFDEDEFDSRHYGEKKPQEVDTTVPTLVVEPQVQANNFEGVAVWFVSKFLERSGQQVSSNESFPYLARIYLTEALVSSAKGATPLLQRAPRLFGIVGALLSRKSVTMYNGSISYSFDVEGVVNTSEFVQSGPAGANSRINFGVKSPSDVVNGNIPLSEPPISYTQELGSQAVQFMFDFLEQDMEDPIFRQEVYPLLGDRWTHDPSAFAWSRSVLGGGNYSVGSQFTLVGMESNIPTPLASVFVQYNSTVNLGRSAKYVFPTVGDSNFATGMMAVKLDEKQFASKRHPVIKYYDFNEVVDIVARTIARGQQQAVDDEDYRRQFDNNSNIFVERIQFPVTFQRLKLVLRSLCMKIDPDSQLTGSTVHPVAEVGNVNVFRPFVTGAGQGPYTGGTPLKLPLPIMEMLAACKGKHMDPKAWETTPLNWIPVWGVYSRDQLHHEDYTVTQVIKDTTTVLQSFPDDVIESVIDLVDGTVGNRVAWMNDSAYLAADTLLINNWFKNNAEYFVSRTELSPDGGISVLATVAETNHVIDFAERTEAKVIKKRIYIPDEDSMTVEKAAKIRAAYAERMKVPKKHYGIATNFYNNRKRVAVTRYDSPQVSVAVGMGQFVLRPTNNLTNIVNETDNNSIQTMQGNYREYHLSTESQGVNQFADLGQEHQEIANLCVRNKYGPEDTDIAIFEKAALEGEGGLIGDLIKGAGKMVTDTGASLINAGISAGVDRYNL